MEERKVPELRFKEFSQAWKLVEFGTYVKESAFGPRFSANLYDEDGQVATLRTTDIDIDGNIDYTTMPFAKVFPEEFSDHYLECGDIVVTRSGTIGITGVFEPQNMPVLPGAFLIRFRLKLNIVDPMFIKSYFNSELGKRIIAALAAGGVQKNLTGSSLKNKKFIFPAFEEQQKIASFLTSVDQRIKLLQEKKAQLERYKKGVMQKLFPAAGLGQTPEIRFNDDDGREFPDWEERRLGEVFQERSERGFGNEILLSVSLEYGITLQSESKKKDFSNSDKSKYKRVLKGDIVYNSMRMWQGSSGVSKYDGIVSPAYTVLKSNTYTVSNFFGYYFKTSELIHTFMKYSQGLTSDTWNLKYPAISRIRIRIPSKQEQQKIASFLSSIDESLEQVATQIKQSQQFKQGLLQKMFV